MVLAYTPSVPSPSTGEGGGERISFLSPHPVLPPPEGKGPLPTLVKEGAGGSEAVRGVGSQRYVESSEQGR
jgi:hypothetical protein